MTIEDRHGGSEMRDIASLGRGWKARFTPFDASEFLDSEEAIAEYLAAALADPDPDLFVAALGDVAKVRGASRIRSRA